MSDQTFLLNIINQLLCYGDQAVTDNPHMRAIDHRRRVESLSVKNPYQNNMTLKPGQSFKLFENAVSAGFDNTTTLDLTMASSANSVYRLKKSAGAGSFRTARSVSGLAACAVTVNNSSMAVFDFTGATLSTVQVGDIMRIAGQKTYDAGPTYAFNPLNSGSWIVIGISGTKISAVRRVSQNFEGIVENVAAVGTDVQFFADDGIAVGNKFTISAGFSGASFGTYEVQESTPDEILFMSARPLPEETGIAYQNNSIIFYTGSKKLIYIEVDQEAVVRFDGDTGNSNRVTPIKAGDRMLPGYLHKWGDTISCEIVNRSVTSCNIKYFTCE